MNEFLRRYDLLWTVVVFALMVPAEYFQSFTLIEDEFLAYRHLLRWALADESVTSFRDDVVVLVNTDEEFYEDYGGFPLRRLDYGALAENLTELGASVVAVDALMDYPSSYGEDPGTARSFAVADDVLLVSKADIDADGRTFIDLTYPISRFREVSRSGYTNIQSQSALRTRMTRLRIFPEITRRTDGWPFAVQALAMHWGVEPRLDGGRLVLGDRLDVPLERGTDFYIDFPRLVGDSRFLSETYAVSAQDVLDLRRLSEERRADLRLDVEGKIALVGDTSDIAQDIFDTPVGRVYGVEIIADTIHTLVNGVPLRPAPFWMELLSILAMMGLVLATALVRQPATRVLLTLLLFAAFVSVAFALYVGAGLVLSITYNLVAGVIGVILINLRYYLVTDESMALSTRESAESNRMLALAFQGQGQLDMAFDKFRKIDLDAPTADLVYNLALDYERKRQYNKAVSVYDYLLAWDPAYRDAADRRDRARALDENPMKNAGGSAGTSIILGQPGMEKPMLGRYEVTKELGQGAMGIVYLGEDPKINRTVAIKTMSLAQEFEADVLDEVKDRFFREAQSAGRLNHPNIVTMYDAGEENDLAYIAMEFLKGHDLARYTKGDALLPLDEVLSIVIQCAEALDYAHGQGVVHRDVKPSNIMYDPDTGQVKLTDFGIARIADSSKTRTGTILGTPNYMSPEQALGDRVDGRSDLFSLGVVLFQLCSGRLPFTGDSMASLMYKIVNEPHADVTTVRSGLPQALRKIIDNALGKKPERRYQQGRRMAEHLRKCRDWLRATQAGA
jgi:CHASE2 domain-containing sensor protein/tRNA A-37 threonylcarbamoyl transferase component Bud32